MNYFPRTSYTVLYKWVDGTTVSSQPLGEKDTVDVNLKSEHICSLSIELCQFILKPFSIVIYCESKEVLVEQAAPPLKVTAPKKSDPKAAQQVVVEEVKPPEPPKEKNHTNAEIGRCYFQLANFVRGNLELKSVASKVTDIYKQKDVVPMSLTISAHLS